MTTFIDASPIYQRTCLILVIILLILNIVDIICSIKYKVRIPFIILSGLLLMFSIFSLVTLSNMFESSENEELILHQFFASMSIYTINIIILILTIISIIGVVMLGIWRKNNISPMSVKDSLDKMPMGICFFNDSGLPLLTNLKIDDLSNELFGQNLLNGQKFWEQLSKGEVNSSCIVLQSGINPIIKHPNGDIISYKCYTHTIRKNKVYEILCTDISEKYYLSLSLESKNKALREMNNRLVEYGNNIMTYTRDKEVLNAKIRIHDDMGKLLLLTRKKLKEELTTSKKDKMLQEWKNMMLIFGTIQEDNKETEIDELIVAGKNIGVTIFYENNIESEKYDFIIFKAMHEALINVVKHAKGNELYFTVNQDFSGDVIIEIKNNGIQPVSKIKEGGGLSSLRSLIEKRNGHMVVNSMPEFKLTIIMKEK